MQSEIICLFCVKSRIFYLESITRFSLVKLNTFIKSEKCLKYYLYQIECDKYGVNLKKYIYRALHDKVAQSDGKTARR